MPSRLATIVPPRPARLPLAATMLLIALLPVSLQRDLTLGLPGCNVSLRQGSLATVVGAGAGWSFSCSPATGTARWWPPFGFGAGQNLAHFSIHLWLLAAAAALATARSYARARWPTSTTPPPAAAPPHPPTGP